MTWLWCSIRWKMACLRLQGWPVVAGLAYVCQAGEQKKRAEPRALPYQKNSKIKLLFDNHSNNEVIMLQVQTSLRGVAGLATHWVAVVAILPSGSPRRRAGLVSFCGADRSQPRSQPYLRQRSADGSNILLDPSNKKAFDNLRRAGRADEDSAVAVCSRRVAPRGGGAVVGHIKQWQPLQAQVVSLSGRGNRRGPGFAGEPGDPGLAVLRQLLDTAKHADEEAERERSRLRRNSTLPAARPWC